MSSPKLLVYLQALAVSFSVTSGKFVDLNSSNFAMSHSSKTALAFAVSLGFPEIVAAGFSPILQEALARGATEVAPMPLCDDPQEQASFFPEGDFSHLIIGENPDWAFTGASLCGVLGQSRNLPLNIISPIWAPKSNDLSKISLILVLDSGEHSSNIDVRRIKYSTSTNVQPENVLGNSEFAGEEEKRTENIMGTLTEISSILSRKFRRLAGHGS